MEIPLGENVEYRTATKPKKFPERTYGRGQKVFNAAVALFMAAATLLAGVRIACGGLCSFVREGRYTAYLSGDEELKLETVPLLGVRGAYERVDTYGGREDADELLERLSAKDVRTENIGDVTVIYAFSPFLPQSVTVLGERTNVMIALSRGKMVVGYPLIKGSY